MQSFVNRHLFWLYINAYFIRFTSHAEYNFPPFIVFSISPSVMFSSCCDVSLISPLFSPCSRSCSSLSVCLRQAVVNSHVACVIREKDWKEKGQRRDQETIREWGWVTDERHGCVSLSPNPFFFTGWQLASSRVQWHCQSQSYSLSLTAEIYIQNSARVQYILNT